MRLSSILLISVALAACADRDPVSSASATPVVDDEAVAGTCDHSGAAWAIGQPGDADTLERARLDAGAGIARFLRPGQAVTMEYSARRLNLDLDAGNVVTGARCG